MGDNDPPKRDDDREDGEFSEEEQDPTQGYGDGCRSLDSDSGSQDSMGKPKGKAALKAAARRSTKHHEIHTPSDVLQLGPMPDGIKPDQLEEALSDHLVATFEWEFLGTRNGRGYLQFPSVADAVDFGERFDWELTGLKVARPARGAMGEGHFSVQVLYNHVTELRHLRPPATPWHPSLQGAVDVATDPNYPSQTLVVYQLPNSVDEKGLAEGMMRLEVNENTAAEEAPSGGTKLRSTAPGDNPPGGARPGSLRRVFLMREFNRRKPFCYGFAEFWSVRDATEAMSKFRAFRSFNFGHQQVHVSPMRQGVFVPVEPYDVDMRTWQWHRAITSPSDEHVLLKYRDGRLYPCERTVTNSMPASLFETSAGAKESAMDAKQVKKRKADGPAGTPASKKPGPMAGMLATWQKKSEELRGPSAASAPAAESEGSTRFASDSKKGAPTRPDVTPLTTSTEEPVSAEVTEDVLGRYSDVAEKPKCLLCQRQFKTAHILRLHENSAKHQENLQQEELVKKAESRIKALPPRPKEHDPKENESYRDRANERRQANMQPKKAPVAFSMPSTARPNPPPPKIQQTKGAALMEKMGYKEGAGLGANGEGRTQSIEQTAYKERAGLGAEDGNLGDATTLAEKKTRGEGYAEWLDKGRDRARERYQQM